MTIKEAQELLEAWVHKHPAQIDNEFTLMTELTEKMSELVRKATINHSAQSNQSELSKELSDLMWTIIHLANRSNIDLTSALIDNLERKNREQ